LDSSASEYLGQCMWWYGGVGLVVLNPTSIPARDLLRQRVQLSFQVRDLLRQRVQLSFQSADLQHKVAVLC